MLQIKRKAISVMAALAMVTAMMPASWVSASAALVSSSEGEYEWCEADWYETLKRPSGEITISQDANFWRVNNTVKLNGVSWPKYTQSNPNKDDGYWLSTYGELSDEKMDEVQTSPDGKAFEGGDITFYVNLATGEVENRLTGYRETIEIPEAVSTYIQNGGDASNLKACFSVGLEGLGEDNEAQKASLLFENGKVKYWLHGDTLAIKYNPIYKVLCSDDWTSDQLNNVVRRKFPRALYPYSNVLLSVWDYYTANDAQGHKNGEYHYGALKVIEENDPNVDADDGNFRYANIGVNGTLASGVFNNYEAGNVNTEGGNKGAVNPDVIDNTGGKQKRVTVAANGYASGTNPNQWYFNYAGGVGYSFHFPVKVDFEVPLEESLCVALRDYDTELPVFYTAESDNTEEATFDVSVESGDDKDFKGVSVRSAFKFETSSDLRRISVDYNPKKLSIIRKLSSSVKVTDSTTNMKSFTAQYMGYKVLANGADVTDTIAVNDPSRDLSNMNFSAYLGQDLKIVLLVKAYPGENEMNRVTVRYKDKTSGSELIPETSRTSSDNVISISPPQIINKYKYIEYDIDGERHNTADNPITVIFSGDNENKNVTVYYEQGDYDPDGSDPDDPDNPNDDRDNTITVEYREKATDSLIKGPYNHKVDGSSATVYIDQISGYDYVGHKIDNQSYDPVEDDVITVPYPSGTDNRKLVIYYSKNTDTSNKETLVLVKYINLNTYEVLNSYEESAGAIGGGQSMIKTVNVPSEYGGYIFSNWAIHDNYDGGNILNTGEESGAVSINLTYENPQKTLIAYYYKEGDNPGTPSEDIDISCDSATGAINGSVKKTHTYTYRRNTSNGPEIVTAQCTHSRGFTVKLVINGVTINNLRDINNAIKINGLKDTVSWDGNSNNFKSGYGFNFNGNGKTNVTVGYTVVWGNELRTNGCGSLNIIDGSSLAVSSPTDMKVGTGYEVADDYLGATQPSVIQMNYTASAGNSIFSIPRSVITTNDMGDDGARCRIFTPVWLPGGRGTYTDMWGNTVSDPNGGPVTHYVEISVTGGNVSWNDKSVGWCLHYGNAPDGSGIPYVINGNMYEDDYTADAGDIIW
ncbi:MAG: hypothetical protein PUF72_05575 [Clostridiales bacterium]|nr:hypothetical protein [Clostridiales bacterium]